MRVTALIVSYNGRERLARCLVALGAQSLPPDELVVVDNASTDGSAELIRERFPEVRLIASPRNLGFAAGNNLGIARARSEAVLLLNDDTVPEPGALGALVTALEDDDRLSAVAATMVFASRPDIVASAGIEVFRNGLALDRGLGAPLRTLAQPAAVFGASAGAALYRRAALEDAGFFPAAFFMYLEDVDLAWRLRLRGWKALHVPEAVVRHDYAASSVEGSPFKRRLLARNRLWMLARCFPAALLAREGRSIASHDLAAAGYALATMDWASARGRLEGFCGLPARLPERRRIQGSARVDPASLASWLAPNPSPRELLRLRGLAAAYAVG